MSRRSAALFLILLPLALLVGSGYSRSPYINRAIFASRARLVEVLGPFRPVEGRLTGGFSYAPYDPSQSRLRLSRNHRIALRKFSQESVGPNSEATADRALLKLLDGNPRQAVEDLEALVVTRPADAALLSDLSTAYMADAQVNGEAYSRVKALEAAENAVTLDPKLQEARFNRAIALESLFLRNQAQSAWDGYLQLDRESAWAREARKRKGALGGPDAASRWALQVQKLEKAVSRNDQETVSHIVAQYPQATREYAEEKLFGDWAAAELAKRSGEARETLSVVRTLGIALARTNGEDMVAAAVKTIDRTVEPSRRSLATGHFAYQKGLQLYGEGKFAEARERFAAALSALHDAASPFAHWATFRLAVCEMQLFHYETSFGLLIPLHQSGFRSLVGRSLWVRGLILAIQGRYAESVALYRSAIQHFATIGESENLTVVRSLVAECLAALGDYQRAWKFHQDALRLAKDLRSPIRRQQVLEEASSTALQGENPSVALDLLQEALGVASPPHTPAALYCLRRKALAHSRLQQSREAQESLREAKSMVPDLPDENVRKSVLGDLLAAEGRIMAVKDPSAAIAQLTRAIQIYRGTEYSAQLALLFSERARAYRAIGDMPSAESDLRQAVTAVQSQHTLVADILLKISYMEEFRSIFDDMVDLQVQLGRKDLALYFVESARAQVLRESLRGAYGGEVREILTVQDLQESLPDHVALIEYYVLPRKLLAWVIQRGSLDIFQTEISPAGLKLLTEHFRQEVLASSADLRHDVKLRSFSELLIGRLRPAIQGVTALVLIPDRDLHSVPFAAVLDGKSGQYLIEQYVLSMAPSANIYLQVLERRRRMEAKPDTDAMVVGDPDFDSSVLYSLSRLPQAREEAKEVAALYSRAQLLLGSAATKKRFLWGLARFDLIHFAGHAVNSPLSPPSSFLALAPAGQDSGILYSRELYNLRRMRARLVVLSACSGLSGTLLGEEGVENLARPFLAAGVPAVIASSWRVNDRSAREFFLKFYAELLAGVPVADALRQAQVRSMKSADPMSAAPVSWAGFQLIGAGS
jgi:CHAT domain-containing protein